MASRKLGAKPSDYAFNRSKSCQNDAYKKISSTEPKIKIIREKETIQVELRNTNDFPIAIRIKYASMAIVDGLLAANETKQFSVDKRLRGETMQLCYQKQGSGESWEWSTIGG
uniref:MSP domain-containing protein n=1 Tax=Panagrolaimus sp. ES5 TaxID=591445 RepID=A0AC34FXK0_9BILA